MSVKPPLGLNYREFDAERDRNGVFFMWLFAIPMLAFAVYLIIIGLVDDLHNLMYCGMAMLPGAVVMLQAGIQTRRRIKAYDAQKSR